jgi:hypothetical protein
MVELLVQHGADVNASTGGDLVSPVYLSLCELHTRAFRRIYGVDACIQDMVERGSVLSQNMVTSASHGLLSADEMRELCRQRLRSPQIADAFREGFQDACPESDGDEERLLAIVRLLLSHGAKPDTIERNGFSPLGYCQEIEEEVGNVGARASELLRQAGATAVVRWSEIH